MFTLQRFDSAGAWVCVTLGCVFLLPAPKCEGKEPDAAKPGDAAKTWEFTAGKDAFKDDALLDLRYLNEKEAGATGFVKRSADGSGFVLGDGTPVRFWAVG